MDHPQRELLDASLEAACRICGDHALALVSEQVLRMEILRALLARGCMLDEPGTGGRESSHVELVGGMVMATLGDRLPELKIAGGSVDVRVMKPCILRLELKCRGPFGSNADLHGLIAEDLDRVCSGDADALILAATEIGFQAWRGIKADARGRKPTVTYTTVLPDLDAVTMGSSLDSDGKWGAAHVKVHTRRVTSVFGDGSRRICAVFR